MIAQLKAIVGFKEEEKMEMADETKGEDAMDENGKPKKELDAEFLKTRIESLSVSPRTMNALANANIRTIGGLVRKKEEDILDIEGLGNKGVQEIKKALSNFGIALK